MGNPIDVNDILIFVRVAQAGSFSRAAALLRMPVSTVSRRVAELESGLGMPLLIRTTRSLKITDVGKSYLEHGVAIAAELEKAESLTTNLRAEPQGRLRITATTDFGNRFLGGIVSEFLREHPRVEAEILLTERVVDLIEEGFDLGIRMGELDDSSSVARKLGTLDSQLYAGTAYLRRRGEPRSCAELAKFDCIRFTGDADPDRWHLAGPRGAVTVRVGGRILANDMALIRDFAVAGEGVALMPHFFCTEEVKAGRLKPMLPDWVQASGPIHVVYPGQRFVLPRVRAFVDHLARSCAKVRWRYRA